MFDQAQDASGIEISYTNDDVSRQASRPQLKLGWFKFRVLNAKNVVSKSGSLMTVLQCNPVNDLGQTETLGILHRITLPFVNPRISGHTAPRTAWVGQQYLIATNPDKFAAFAKKEGVNYVNARGNILSSDEAEAERETLVLDVMAELENRWKNPGIYDGEEFFGKVESDGQYRNIVKCMPTEPEGEDVEYSEFVDNV